MSIRNIRKLYGGNSLPPPESNSDGDYEPNFNKVSPSKFKYIGLELSSKSESEHESADAVAMENTASNEVTKKKKKKKKKQRKTKMVPGSNSKETIEMDEIDKYVMEVNALLGSPPIPTVSTEKPAADPALELLSVQQKHLNVANELMRLFGPEAVEPTNRRRGRQPNLTRILKKAVIIPMPQNHSINFQKCGLSMSIQRQENGCTYFTFDHSREYQRMHSLFLKFHNSIGVNNDIMLDAPRKMHMEGLLLSADSMFRMEEYDQANSLIEHIVAYMQHVAHPSFNLTNSKTRLEYKFLENRTFHIAVLKYLHLLTNRACHRTALELAKLLFNLDPSDPLAILFIIDTIALRAREHQWLIDAIDHWGKERHAGFLFNMQYSCVLAYFHVTTKNKGDLSTVDKMIQNTIMRYPYVARVLLKLTNKSTDRHKNHPLFRITAQKTTPAELKCLIIVYGNFCCSKWREPAVIDWFVKNVNVVLDKYDSDKDFQFTLNHTLNQMLCQFPGEPEEVLRHFSIIKPMADLLVDGEVPNGPHTFAWDPLPPYVGINRYGYNLNDGTATTSDRVGGSTIYELFASMLPTYTLPATTPVLEERQHVEFMEEAAQQEDRNIGEIEPGADAGNDAEAELDTDTVTDEDDVSTEN